MNKAIKQLKRMKRFLSKFTPAFIIHFFIKLSSAFITPIHFSQNTGHFRSSWKKKSVDRKNQAIPWYTYPLIDFLKCRNFEHKTVLEIGGGQSSSWWAGRAQQVYTLEGDQEWYKSLTEGNTYKNLDIKYIDTLNQDLITSFDIAIAEIQASNFDVIIIDGMDRARLVAHCIPLLSESGMIIIDDAERYDFTEIFGRHNFQKVDFYGYAPGVLFPKCSSIQFKATNDLFSNTVKVVNGRHNH